MSTPGADDEQRGSDDSPLTPGGAGPHSDPGPHHEPVHAPSPVNVSCVLWGVAGVLLVAGFVVTLLSQDRIVADFMAQGGDEELSAARLAEGVSTAVWGLLIGAVAYVGLIGLFVYKAREGTRSARSVLTVLTVVLVVAQFALFPNTVTVLATMVAVVALVLMYLPSVADHFPRVPKSLP